jgi:hypothetical protein
MGELSSHLTFDRSSPSRRADKRCVVAVARWVIRRGKCRGTMTVHRWAIREVGSWYHGTVSVTTFITIFFCFLFDPASFFVWYYPFLDVVNDAAFIEGIFG